MMYSSRGVGRSKSAYAHWLRLHNILAMHDPPLDAPLQTYIDLWVIRNGEDWVDLTEEMLIDQSDCLGHMTRVLARANMLEQHYMTETMTFKAKIKKGV